VTGAPWALSAVLCWHLAASGGLPKEVPLDQVRSYATGQRQVRVLIWQRATTLTLRPRSAAVIEDPGTGQRLAGVAGGAAVSLRPSGGRAELKAGRYLTRAGRLRLRSLSGPGIVLSGRGGVGRQGLYAGTLEVSAAGGGLRVVEQVDLETYVAGVVAGELPNGFPPEAKRALAIAARSYALFHLGDHAQEGADLCAQVHCQAYAGAQPDDSSAAAAAAATAGKVLTWNGLLVDALYHAACGGATAPAWEVGPGRLLPYLSGSSDCEREGEEAVAYCRRDHEARWQRTLSRQQAERLVAANLGVVLGRPALSAGRLESLRVVGRAGARAEWLEVTTAKGTYRVRGDSIRWLFGNGRPGASGLPSTRFSLSLKRDQRGRPRGFVFQGVGRGHGIGLCQWGARGRAEAGQSAAEILAAYYPGAVIESLTGK
jgi:stage II sporulation protein D